MTPRTRSRCAPGRLLPVVAHAFGEAFQGERLQGVWTRPALLVDGSDVHSSGRALPWGMCDPPHCGHALAPDSCVPVALPTSHLLACLLPLLLLVLALRARCSFVGLVCPRVR